MPFTACELEIPPSEERARLVRSALRASPRSLLILDTCQRLECFGLEEPDLPCLPAPRIWRDAEAFERLVRIAAGLESRILGELEILGQVREAYRQFQETHASPSAQLDRIFQDALALARKARKESGIDQSLTSLSGLAARTLLGHIPAGRPMAVVGAGSLAGSVARYLGKRGQAPVRVASRCPENALNLASEIGGFGTGLDELTHLFEGVGGIVTATAAPHPVVYPHHLLTAGRPLTIVDLGVPPDCAPSIGALDGITYISLRDIEAKSETNVAERKARGEVAGRIIRDGAQAWARGRGAAAAPVRA